MKGFEKEIYEISGYGDVLRKQQKLTNEEFHTEVENELELQKLERS